MATTKADAIRPFSINVPDEALVDLRRRINTDKMARAGDGHGRLARRAARDDAEARALLGDGATTGARCEARLNAVPHFITEIDGLDIHFIHVRSKHENALPMIVTHGWPGSIIEQLKIIDPLTNPTAHGGSAADAFHLVIPSLPGYGFSGKPTAPGWNPRQHRQGVGDADAAPRLHAVRGAGRRLGQRRHGDDGPAAAARACSASTPTWRPRFRPTSPRRSPPAARRRPASRPTRSTPGISSTISTRTGSATPSR